MGHFGNPRYLCAECEALIEKALKSHDTSASEEAMERLGKTVSESSADDTAVVEAVEEIFKSAKERNEKIKEGTYDFSLDEEDEGEGEFDEIPEELLETEEDKAETEREEETNRKFGKVLDIITAVIFVAAIAVFAYYFIKK